MSAWSGSLRPPAPAPAWSDPFRPQSPVRPCAAERKAIPRGRRVLRAGSSCPESLLLSCREREVVGCRDPGLLSAFPVFVSWWEPGAGRGVPCQFLPPEFY